LRAAALCVFATDISAARCLLLLLMVTFARWLLRVTLLGLSAGITR
jgi:hypothetical protein